MKDSHYQALNFLSQKIYQANVDAGWWTDLDTGKLKTRNKGELMMLMVTEISEAMEGVRKSIKDTHLTHRSMEEVELADTLIRIFDYCGAYNIDLGGALKEKLEYNKTREDHQIKNRLKENGKKC